MTSIASTGFHVQVRCKMEKALKKLIISNCVVSRRALKAQSWLPYPLLYNTYHSES